MSGMWSGIYKDGASHWAIGMQFAAFSTTVSVVYDSHEALADPGQARPGIKRRC